ncbi:MAG: class I SAM-dependent methyltransferase [Tissierellia bacterium]|nr:class I SAM-dependent methyltransferase [Tissierellia bacterium]
MSKKIRIEKNSVQETLIVPLYGRKMCAEKFPELYFDKSAKELCDKLDYDFSELELKKDKFSYEFGALEAAMRQLDIMWEIKDYLKKYPNATIVNLGCGLDQTGKACDNGTCKIVNIDFPEIIEIRENLIDLTDRELNIACDLTDYSWMDNLDGSEGVVFFAAGVFHYIKKEKVKEMVLELAKRFPGGRLIFDTVGKFGLKLMLSMTLKNMKIKDVEGFFYANNPEEDLKWSESIDLMSKPYMLGYYDMRSPGITKGHRILAKIGDKYLKMAINRMDFI